MRKSIGTLIGGIAVAVSMVLSGAQAMADESKTYVLIHGAWHGAWTFDHVTPLIEEAGHQVVAVDLPGHGMDMTPLSEITLTSYAQKVAEIIDQQDGDVVLVAHSLGGGAATLVGEMRAEKIESIVYVAAFMPRNGETLLDLALSDEAALVFPNLVLPEDQSFSFFKRDGAIEVFYHDVNEQDAKEAVLRLNWQPGAPYVQPMETTEERFGTIPRIYIKTLQDRAVTPELQQRMIDAMPPAKVVEMNTSHSPFLSDPEGFVRILIENTND